MDTLRDDAFLYDRLLREAGCKTYVKVYVRFPCRGLPSLWALGLMSLQLSRSPAYLPYDFSDAQIFRKIPVRRQSRTEMAAQRGQRLSPYIPLEPHS